MAHTVRILSIDGGGIRGIIPALILHELEKRSGRAVASLFDLVAGTSAGGIIALGLVCPAPDGRTPRYTALELSKFFEQEGPRIFSRSVFHYVNSLNGLLASKYEAGQIDTVLQQYFGNVYLDEALVPVLVPAYEIERRDAYFFKSYKAKSGRSPNFLIREVARATSAAPTYFDPVKINTKDATDSYALVDGGVYASNPAMCAYVEAQAMYPGADCVVVSLGTGVHTKPLPFDQVCGWGKSRWAQSILDIVFDGISDTIHHQLSRLLPAKKNMIRYARLQPDLKQGNEKLDNAQADNIVALKRVADDLIGGHDELLTHLSRQLTTLSE